MADSDASLSRSVSSRTLLLFLEAFLLRPDIQTPMLTGKYSESFRSWVDFSTYKFCCRHKSLKDAKLLFAYLKGADSYKLQIIVFAF